MHWLACSVLVLGRFQDICFLHLVKVGMLGVPAKQLVFGSAMQNSIQPFILTLSTLTAGHQLLESKVSQVAM